MDEDNLQEDDYALKTLEKYEKNKSRYKKPINNDLSSVEQLSKSVLKLMSYGNTSINSSQKDSNDSSSPN